MRGLFPKFLGVIVLTSFASGQSTETLPFFDAADVHVSPKSVNPNVTSTGGFVRGGKYQFKNATMLDLIASAYSVEPDKVVGGPSWLETDRFDILAKAPASATNANAKLMLKSLLADRFKLAIHNEDKPMNAFVMTMTKPGPQLKQSAGAGPTNCQSDSTSAPPHNVINCTNMTLAFLAGQVLRQLDGLTFQSPVTDLTGVEGSWDFQLKWTGSNNVAAAGKDAIPIQEALEKQLGLKVEMQKRSLPTLVVDSVNRKPTDNVAGVEKLLPVVSTEFEVADLKPSKPDAPSNGRLQPGGRIDLLGIPLKDLLLISMGVANPNGNTPPSVRELLSGPKFLETDKWDIVAKAPADVAIQGDNVDVDTLLGMLRTMLIDRFKIKFHTEEQPLTVYAFIAPKKETKLKPADPASRSRCTRTVDGNRGGLPPLATLTCQNTTLAQLAEKLPAMAPAYFEHPAVDASGLQGGFDFAVSWTPRANLNGGGNQQQQQPGAAAAEPNGAFTLYEGVERLGLKLELQKHPYPILVIDHIEQKPTEN